MKEIVIDVKKVSKKYKKSETLALSDITFQVEKGAIAAFLGPNGAGKSTMIKIILGIIRATEGHSCLLGRDSAKLDASIYRQIGVFMGGKTNLIQLLPVMDSLKYISSIYHAPRIVFQNNVNKYGELLQCGEFLSRPVSTLSLGQRIRAELLSILIYNPQVLILDEPTLGLDIEGKKVIHHMLRNLSEETGITILLTTHDLIGLDRLCGQIMLINHGKKLIDWTKEELTGYLQEATIVETDMEFTQYSKELVDTNRYLLNQKQLAECKNILAAKGNSYTFVRYSQPTMEDLLYAYYR